MSEFDPFTLFDVDEKMLQEELTIESPEEIKKKPKRKPLALFLIIATIVLLVVLCGSYFLYLYLDYNNALPEEVISLLGSSGIDEVITQFGPTGTDFETDETEYYDEYESYSYSDLGIGYSADLDNLNITLDRASIWSGDDQEPKKGYQYLLLEWNVLNNTRENFNLSKLDFDVTVDGENVRPADVSYKDVLDEKKVDAGDDENGGMVYEVPKDWSECEITVSTASADESATYDIVPADLD